MESSAEEYISETSEKGKTPKESLKGLKEKLRKYIKKLEEKEKRRESIKRIKRNITKIKRYLDEDTDTSEENSGETDLLNEAQEGIKRFKKGKAQGYEKNVSIKFIDGQSKEQIGKARISITFENTQQANDGRIIKFITEAGCIEGEDVKISARAMEIAFIKTKEGTEKTEYPIWINAVVIDEDEEEKRKQRKHEQITIEGTKKVTQPHCNINPFVLLARRYSPNQK